MTLEELRLTPLYKKNAVFYDLVIDRYKGISNHKKGFIIYFYEQQQIDYSSHEEFNFYNHKLARIEKSIKNFISIDIENKLTKGLNDLTDLTNTLIANPELKAFDLKSYRSKVYDIQKVMCDDNLYHILNGLKIEISDLRRNLPKTPTPIITHKYFIPGSSESSIHITLDIPSELKRAPIMNGFLFPLEIHKDQCVIWTGHTPAPKIGGGSREFWKLIDDNWECVTTNSTWIS
tara:strand:+ start:84 stop:782 length:699 start_codon:yes stop_codon:yes gene_type:complete